MPVSSVKTKAVEVINAYVGVQTGVLYEKFYQDKDDTTVTSSLKELLTEFAGEQKAREILMDQGLEVLEK